MVGKRPRIVAVFRPQAWINDYACDVDGRKEFDCTLEILRMSVDEIHALRDDQDETDTLLPDRVRGGHGGPFRIEVQEAIGKFFRALGFDEVTEEAVQKARKLYGVRSRKKVVQTSARRGKP